MPVTGSAFTIEGAQADGSRWCREVHTVAGGGTVDFYYLTPEGFDPTSTMNGRVAVVNEMLVEQEASANLDRDGALTSVHITGAQMIVAFREEVRNATRERACYLAWWLLRRIAAGHVTDTQARNAFGMSAVQWTTFKANTVTPRSNAWTTVLEAAGA